MAKAHTVDDAEHTFVPGSPLQDLSSNFGSPDGSVPDLERVGARSTSTMEDKIEAILAKRFAQFDINLGALASIPMFVQASPDLKTVSCHSHNQWRPLQTRFASVEQVVGGLAARVAALEAGANSASSVSG